MFDGLRLQTGALPEIPAPPQMQRQGQLDLGLPVATPNPEAVARHARTEALKRHARAVDAVFTAQDQGQQATPEQHRELADARKAFEAVRPHGWRDAEAAYANDPSLAADAARGRVNRAIRALQTETEVRTNPRSRADRFVQRWQELDTMSTVQYQAGDMSGHKATRAAMGDMAKSLMRDPQLESLLANRKHELGIMMNSGRSLGAELAFNHGIDIGRGRGLGL
nr:hypothetical protein [Hephaestia mangrovi]